MTTHLATTQNQWAETLTARQAHLLQSWAWGELKTRFGWRAWRIQIEEAMAQVLFRRLPLGLSIAYIPKGPVVEWDDAVQVRSLLSAIRAEARKQKAIFLKLEPDVLTNAPQAEAIVAFLQELGFIPGDTIQPRTSQIIDISPAEEDILVRMKQKTRYNIRLAQKKGVTIREGDLRDVAIFHEMSQVTASRDGFDIHSRSYYETAFELFAPERCTLLLAEYQGDPLAALMVFRQDRAAYYFYGASNNHQRNLMPTYLLQWSAIEWARRQGCTRYDLWGIPDDAPTTLEAEFQQRNDGLWGVYRFKRGFGGEIVRSIGAFDYVYNWPLYQMYKLYRRLSGFQL